MTAGDVIVIGSGVGGSAVGALLANTGKYRVTLIEKSGLIGGRFASYDKDGFRLDVGCHMLANCDRGLFGRALEICGCPDYVKWRYAVKPSPSVNFKGQRVRFPYDAEKMGFSKEEADRFMKFFFDISQLSDADCDRLNDTSISDYVSKYVNSDLARGLIGFFTAIYFVTRDDETPIGEYARCQNEIWRNKAVGYPIGGTGAVPGAYCRIIRERGGRVRTGTGVRQIVVEDGKAAGVVLENGEKIKADIVISNAAFKDTVHHLVGKDLYPAEFTEKVNRYRYSYSTSVVQIALDEIISNDSMVFYIGRSDLSEFEKRIETTGILPEEAPCLMIPIVSNMDPEAAPEGKQLMIVGGSAKLPYNAGAERWKMWEQAIMNALETVFPGIRRHILWTVSTTPEDINHFGSEDGAVIGIGQIIGQVGEDRPKIVDPHVRNLYHCSADTGLHGIGGELAMDAAFRLYEHLA
ncbi:MAG: phytoene desaturase family protein [Syntrophales bacterium]